MRIRFVAQTLALLAALMVLAPVAQAFSDKPLMVIRFNQRKVYFDQPLYTAVSKALARKSDVMFVLVSYIPVAGNPQQDEALAQRAAANVRDVTAAMVKMGVPPQQMSTQVQSGAGLQYDEVHMFVQ